MIFALDRQNIEQYETADIDLPRVLEWVHNKIEQNIGDYIAVRCDGEPAGYYCCRREDGELELDELFVLPPYRNMGIGTAIVRKILSECAEPIILYVFLKNTRARALYERLGFRVIKEFGASRCLMRHDNEKK